VTKSAGRELSLRLRQPMWAAPLKVTLDHHPLTGHATNGSLEIRHAWQRGDTLTIHYPLRTRLVPLPQDAGRVGIMCGPWILGVDQQHNPRFFDEPFEQNQILLPAHVGNDEIELKMITEKSKAAPFTVPVAHLRLDYLPGGYPVQPQTAVLRPIAEYTTVADGTSWGFWFQPKM